VEEILAISTRKFYPSPDIFSIRKSRKEMGELCGTGEHVHKYTKQSGLRGRTHLGVVYVDSKLG
jgi:hypothetical protein